MKNMNAAQTDYSIGQDRSFELEVILESPGNSEWIIIPEKIKFVTVTVSFSGGASGKVQTTTDVVDTIRNGSPVFCDWPFGVISITKTEVCKPISGIRAVQVATGTMKITIRAQ